MKQAASFQKLRVPLLLPGITVSTSPTDFYPIQSVQLAALQGRDLGAVRRDHGGREVPDSPDFTSELNAKAAGSGGLFTSGTSKHFFPTHAVSVNR